MDGRDAAGAEIRIVGTERPEGLELRTRGLAARGRPELRVSGLPPYLGQGWARVLAALAGRLARVPAGGPSEPSESHEPYEMELTPEGEGGTPVLIGLKADRGDLVAVPPGGFTGRVEDWRREVLLALFPSAHS
ncbi:hypothetical protein Acsp03_45240 [Actinomadura sp. NBRC 104412]|uniref:hypothetical protein n=1 Tax=Actinomadura sp. NBRC 104412 TaxID=3032203 RepID=UPI0024A15420|nr:hypothetical protein [Actinomadura sp. NBRC 104412]GLZ07058.1 hypothetical protein Acsp03_45240 [Actinomadura sp. NBRC 104412]